MTNGIKKCLRIGMVLCLLTSALPVSAAKTAAAVDEEVHTIVLSSEEGKEGTYTHTALYDGAAVEEFDYTWHADPSEAYEEVKNCPAEYYTGTKPDTEAAVYIAHDITYFPELAVDAFQKVNYNGENEWAYYYTAAGYEEYIFGTLPVQGSGVPTDMMHSEEEAYQNAVLHITQAGTYSLEGAWHGQIWIDLGEDAFDDPACRVTLILNGVDVTCTVAPALVFANVYECDNAWEDQEAWSSQVDTDAAGANVIVADGTENTFSGTNIYRMLKAVYKNSDDTAAVPVQKKKRKIDGAFYSYMSMNIDGQENDSGVLNIVSEFEGLDTELHLTINGGRINVSSQDDGINVNEDGVSVVTVNGGSLHILAGLGNEGDGIDSNGFLVINGGTVISIANPRSDSGLDSDFGTYILGGTVVALGSTMDWAESTETLTTKQAAMNLRFSGSQSADEAIIITNREGTVVFAYDPDKDEVTGANARWYQGAILSAPDLTVGGEYYIYVGGDVTGQETMGVYDISTVTGFSEEAVQQCYTATAENMGGHGPGQNGGERPENPEGGFFGGGMGDFMPGQNGGERPENPEGGFLGGDRGDFMPGQNGGERPELPEDGFFGGDRDDFMPGQNGGERPEMPGDGMSNGVASGTGEKIFRLTANVNNFTGVMDYAQTTSHFTDVTEQDWFYEDVAYVSETGLMNGTGDSVFSPALNTTRGMLVTILYRMEGEPEVSGTVSFRDVTSGAYYEKAVLWAEENNIVNGSGDGCFSPDSPITREQLAVILYRYAKYKQMNVGVGEDTNILSYSDALEVSEYAVDAMQWSCGAGILQGSGTELMPQGQATRAQVAAILHRFCGKVAVS